VDKRLKTRVVKIGNLKIGGKHPVRIKGMLKSPARDTRSLIREAKRLEKEGAEAIRVAVRQKQDAKLSALLKKHVSIPLVGDIHFHPQLARLAIAAGFDGIRLNPLNISRKEEVRKIARAAQQRGVSIRVGVNSGGFRKKFSAPLDLAREMVKVALGYLRTLEQEGLFDIMVSLKGSDVLSTLIANRLLAKKCNYPLHLGVTATGPFLEGLVKSSVGLGSLLSEGIGNVIRVSLTAPSFWEIRAARHILQALDIRRFGPEIISCPTCSRCEVDLASIVDKFKKGLQEKKFTAPRRIAIMGCVVNGPGEACQADIGAAFGKRKAVIFKQDKVLRQSCEKEIVGDLISELDNCFK